MLEKKLYPNKELAPLLGVDINDTAHLKRNILKALKSIGLKEKEDFKFPKNGHTLIMRSPDTIEERLRYACCSMELNVKSNIIDFSIFIYCLLKKEEFDKCPWIIKCQLLKEKYNINTPESTLRYWKDKLINADIIIKDSSDFSWWSTYTKGSITKEKVRKKVIEGSEESQRLKNFIEEFNRREDIQTITDEERMKEFRQSMVAELGKYYYKCYSYKFGAWNNLALQILVDTIKEYLKE